MDASIASFVSSRRRHPLLGPPKARDLDRPVLISLESAVPRGHFYRHLHRTLDLSFVRALTADCYAASGRPSIDPEVFFRTLPREYLL
jgi:transposase